MHDPVEVRRRIHRLLDAVEDRDDYGELLANGRVVREVNDADAWRKAIRAQARADRVHIQTGDGGSAVFAFVVRRPGDAPGASIYAATVREMVAASVALRHEPVLVERHGQKVLLGCDRCAALGYADMEDDFSGGSLLDSACPCEEEPEATALSLT